MKCAKNGRVSHTKHFQKLHRNHNATKSSQEEHDKLNGLI